MRRERLLLYAEDACGFSTTTARSKRCGINPITMNTNEISGRILEAQGAIMLGLFEEAEGGRGPRKVMMVRAAPFRYLRARGSTRGRTSLRVPASQSTTCFVPSFPRGVPSVQSR
jgi:hypothetical protein